jgi:hypothetical protein
MTPQQQGTAAASQFVDKLNDIILFPLIILLSAVAFLFFIYGCAVYIMNANNETAREEGKKHITYGIIGLIIMFSAYAILSIATSTFGLDKQQECANNPSASGCNEIFRLPNPGGTNPGIGPNPGGTPPGSGSNPGGTLPGSGSNPG